MLYMPGKLSRLIVSPSFQDEEKENLQSPFIWFEMPLSARPLDHTAKCDRKDSECHQNYSRVFLAQLEAAHHQPA